MTSKIISGGKTGVVPREYLRKETTIEKRRPLTFKKQGGVEELRDLTLLSPPYDMTTLKSISEISDILQQCIEAYVQNIVGFGMDVQYNVDDNNETPEMKNEWTRLQELLEGLSIERPAKEVLEEVTRNMEQCGNAYMEVIRNGAGEVVGIDSILPEYMTATKLNRVTLTDGTVLKVRYYRYQDSADDSARDQGIWFKTYQDPTPLNANGSVAKEGEGTATEVVHFKIGDFIKPYGIPRYIGPLIKILGNRKADELNYRYFTQGRHIPLAILLENAQLTEASEASLQNYANSIGSEGESQHKFLVIEAEKLGSVDDMIFDETKAKPAVKLEKLSDILQKDALFLDYDQSTVNAVLSAFRLPPVYVGLSQDYNRATVETAKELTEEQVFQPRRESIAWRINQLFVEYEFKYAEVYLKSSNLTNMEDIKAILDPAINAKAVAPNDLRDLLSKVLNKPLEPFDGEQYNYPVELAGGMPSFAGGEIDSDDDSQMEAGDTNGLGQTVQQVSMNGAQITSLVNIVQAVASGTLPRDSAIQMITAAFPFDEAKAELILGDKSFALSHQVAKAYGESDLSEVAASVRRMIRRTSDD